MFSRTHTARANETYRFPDNPTLSDFPLLIGEVIRRADLRDIRRRRLVLILQDRQIKAKALTGVLERFAASDRIQLPKPANQPIDQLEDL